MTLAAGRGWVIAAGRDLIGVPGHVKRREGPYQRPGNRLTALVRAGTPARLCWAVGRMGVPDRARAR